MEQATPHISAPSEPYHITVNRPLGTRIKRTLFAPLRSLGRWVLRKVVDKAHYEIAYLTFHGYNLATATFVAAKLGVFDELKNGPLSAEEIAQRINADASGLYRILRGLASLRYLKQLDDKRFELTPIGELFQEDHPRSLKHWALQWGQDVLPVLPEFENQIRSGDPNAFIRTHHQPYWSYLDENPELSQVFDKKMSRLTVSHLPAIVNAYDFSAAGTLVDVGGGRGALLCEVLKKYPSVKGILYDRPEVKPTAEECITETGMQNRCEIRTGSFLESVPEGGDTYMIKHVLHDWDDNSVATVLKNVRAAMKPGQHLLIMEGFLEHDHFGLDGFRKWTDIYQMVYLPGKQRTLDEMHALLSGAGFRMESLTPTTVPDLAVLQSVAV